MDSNLNMHYYYIYFSLDYVSNGFVAGGTLCTYVSGFSALHYS